MKRCLLDVFSAFGIFPVRVVPSHELRNLMQELHPRSVAPPMVRLGPLKDGGYLVPDDLEGIEACFSPGVSSESGFEMDCANRGMKVFLADKSVDEPTQSHALFNFTKKFVGCTSGEDFMTLDEWVAKSSSKSDSDLLLQMDIEGYEYEVLLSVSDSLMQRFRFLIIEFHFLEQLFGRSFFLIARRVFSKILKTHFCVHTHPNNCCGVTRCQGLDIPCVMEFTFVARSRYEPLPHNPVFPHSLDVDNTSKKSLVLPPCWYQTS